MNLYNLVVYDYVGDGNCEGGADDHEHRKTGEYLTLKELQQHCSARGLSRYKLPRVVVAQVDALPSDSVMGKVSKRAVRSYILASVDKSQRGQSSSIRARL